MNVIPLTLDTIFSQIRTNNAFKIVNGSAEWQSAWQDDEITLLDKARVADSSGEEHRLKLKDGVWSVTYPIADEVYTPLYPFYECGSIHEVVALVRSDSGLKKNTRFPLILLATLDQPYEELDPQFMSFQSEMYLCVKTDPKIHAKERYQVSYQDALLPLLEVVKRYLNRNSITITEDNYVFRERWGQNGLYGREGNVFDSMIDALEFPNKLIFLKENC